MGKGLTRREFARTAAVASAAISVPFIFRRFAHAGDLDPAVLNKFGASLKGKLIVPGDADYDAARRVWNARYDKHPACIARCANTDDVRRSVDFARANELATAVRSGGHSFAGLSTCDGGFVIDLSGMNSIMVEPNY